MSRLLAERQHKARSRIAGPGAPGFAPPSRPFAQPPEVPTKAAPDAAPVPPILPGISSRRASWLRLADRTLAATALIFFLPLLILAALALSLEGGGAPLQAERDAETPGNGTCHRFRIQRAAVPAAAPSSEAAPNLCLTGVGALLWRTRLDDLPRLIDVLLGRAALLAPDRPRAFRP